MFVHAGQDEADGTAGLDAFLGGADQRRPAPLKRHANQPVVARGGRGDAGGFGRVGAGRLLDQDVLAGVQRIHGRLAHVVGLHDGVDHVAVDLVEHAAVVGVAAGDVVGVPGVREPLRVEIADGLEAHVVRVGQHGVVRPRRPSAGADHGGLEHCSLPDAVVGAQSLV